jgi:hypothetical protein
MNKKFLYVASILIILTLAACGPATPTVSTIDIQNTAVAAAWTDIAMTKAALPTATATPIPLTPTPTIQPTATIPLIIFGTFTPTLIPSTVTVSVENTAKGDYLNISRSSDNLEYRLGPIASGAYAIGPNDNYLIYCTNGGDVYAVKFGDQYLTPIGDVRNFSAIQRNVPPDLQLVIFMNNNRYKVDIREGRFNQNEIFFIPGNFTE